MKHLNLSGCKFITKLPALCTPNLETLDLSYCENLVKIDESGKFLHKLKTWNLIGCKSITKLPVLCTPNLETLNLSYCENLVEIHESGEFLHKLKAWILNFCQKLQNLPNNLMLTSLEVLEILILYG